MIESSNWPADEVGGRELDRVCDRFEAAWQAVPPATPPWIEEFLPSDLPARNSYFRELLAIEFHHRLRVGSSYVPADYLARFPQFADLIEQTPVPPLGVPSPSTRTMPLQPRPGVLPGRAVDSQAPAPALVRAPGYEIQSLLGRGAMGVVFLARQIRFNRLVALKMILVTEGAGETARSRFRIEAEAVARLNHGGIVQVYETGEAETGSGFPASYLTMEYCPGGTLAARLGGNPLAPDEAARLVEQIADAVQAAHSAGVIHRDLKPHNVLLDGRGRPKVADFGLAKLIDEAGITLSGVQLGTPAYMAPEQAADSKVVGPAADIYALGAILYECLTGRPPFKAPTALEALDLLRNSQPVPVRHLQPGVPRDLETICLECLHKEPGRRYDSAQELAEDLRRHSKGEPIRARRVGLGEQVWWWARRHRSLAALYAVSSLAAVLLAGLGIWFTGRLREERHKLEMETSRAETAAAREQAAREREQAHQYLGLVGSARTRIARRRPGWTWKALDEIRLAAGLPAAAAARTDLRSDAAECLTALDVREAGSVGKGLVGWSIAWSPDGKTLAVGQRAANFLLPSCSLSLLHADGSGIFRTLLAPQKEVRGRKWKTQDGLGALCYSPGGRFLVAGARSGWLHCWDLRREGGAPIWSRPGHDREVSGLAISRDGRSLFSCGGSTVRRWKPVTGHPVAVFDAQRGVESLALHPQEGWVAAGGTTVFRLNAISLRPIGPEVPFDARTLAFSHDGMCLLGAGSASTCVWHLDGWSQTRMLTHAVTTQNEVSSLQCSPEGALVLTSSTDRQKRFVRLWDAVAGRMVTQVPFDGVTGNIAFAPNGRRFAVTCADGVRLYEVGGFHEETYCGIQLEQPVRSFALDPEGTTLVTEARLHNSTPLAEIRTWSSEGILPWRSRSTIAPGPGDGLSLSVSRQGRLAFAPRTGQADLGFPEIDPAAEASRATVEDQKDLGHDGMGRLWLADTDTVTVWDHQGRRLGAFRHRDGRGRELTGRQGVLSLAPGNRWTAAACRDGSLALLEARPGGASQVALRDLSRSELTAVAIGPDEAHAVAGSTAGELIVVGLPEVRKLSVLDLRDDSVVAVRAAGNGLWASGHPSGMVRLWRVESGELQELLTLRHARPVRDLRFHTDGMRLFVLLEGEHGLRVYHLDRLRQRLESLGLGGDLDVIRPIRLPPPGPRKVKKVEEEVADGQRLRLEVREGVMGETTQVRYPAKPDRAYRGLRTPCQACWSGWVRAPKPGRHRLVVKGEGRIRLWLDGTLMAIAIDASCQAEVDLGKGPHELRIDHWLSPGEPGLKLFWVPPGKTEEEILHPRYLFHRRETARLPGGRR